MSYTYTFNAATCKGGRLGQWTSDWNNFYLQDNNGLWVGKVGSWYYAVYYTFGTATDGTTTYASIQNKTVTGATLTIPLTSRGNGVPASASDALPIRAKNTSTAGSGSSTNAWQWTGSNLGFLREPVTNDKFNISLSSPYYAANGYVMGPNASSCPTFIIIGSAAVLQITTNETQFSYTLAYNANGGSGAPSSQTGSNIQVTASYTFTISNTRPTRTGYEFLGWSTSSTATSASYQPGSTITVSNGTTTLYAVWKRANTIRIVNGSNLDTYLIYVVENGALVPYRATVVNGSNLDVYT